jgi:hypothetical protein
MRPASLTKVVLVCLALAATPALTLIAATLVLALAAVPLVAVVAAAIKFSRAVPALSGQGATSLLVDGNDD